MATIEGTAYWASVLAPNTKYKPKYEVNLVVDREVAENFSQRGFKIKEMEDIGPALMIRRNVNWEDKQGNTHTRPAPKLFDKAKLPLDCQVGNGSRVKVQYREWEKGEWSGLDFQAMQVLDLVEYSGSSSPDGSEFDVDEGFDDGNEL